MTDKSIRGHCSLCGNWSDSLSELVECNEDSLKLLCDTCLFEEEPHGNKE